MTVTRLRLEPPDGRSGPGFARRQPPRWLLVGLAVAAALVLVGLGLIIWAVTHPQATAAKLSLTAVYAPAGSTASAPVYLTVANTGDASDVLTSAGTEFQTAKAARSVSVCGDRGCTSGQVTVPGHGTVVFGANGPHLLVAGLGPLAVGHAPLQLTLTFQGSGVVHVLAPIGGPNNLTQQDVMTYGYMGHRDPGMMGGSDGMPGSPTSGAAASGVAGSGTAAAGTGPVGRPATTTRPAMPGMSMPNG